MKLKSELQACCYLNVINSIVLIYVTTIYFLSQFSIVSFLNLVFVVFLCFFRYRTLRSIHYSYWLLTFVNVLYLVFFLLNFFNKNALLVLILISLVLLITESYLISSPIFYPRASWWEYDFRFRPDIKVKVGVNETLYEARITDVRRCCVSLTMFEKFSVNSNIKIKSSKYNFEIYGKVLTQKEINPGRGLSYGVKLLNNSDNLIVAGIFKERKQKVYRDKLSQEV